MQSKIVKTFKKYDNKFGDEFDISKNELFLLIRKRKQARSNNFSFKEFFVHFILIILSFLSILISKFKKIKTANYFNVLRNSGGKIDFRSKYIVDNFNLSKSLNIVRSVSFIDSLKAYLKYPNVIFYLAFDYFNFLLMKKTKHKNLTEEYLVLHELAKKNLSTFKKIFTYLEIKKFISIDDERIMQTFLKVCFDLKITSIGYMHYRFHDFEVAINYKCFDIFFVWSNFFKKKLLKVNKQYKNKKIVFSGIPKKKLCKSSNSKVNVIYILDNDLNFTHITNILDHLVDNKCKLFIKFKPQNFIEKKWVDYCTQNNIPYFKNETLEEVNAKYNFDYFVATVSTALLEATLYNAIPIIILSKIREAQDLIKDKVAYSVKNGEELLKIASKKPSQAIINKFYKKVWGLNNYNKKNIKNILYAK